jgi:Sigma-70 region 2
MEDTGKFEARYLAFLETISPLRPRLHRYCARMTGSITDGEDVVQDALFRAYRHDLRCTRDQVNFSDRFGGKFECRSREIFAQMADRTMSSTRLAPRGSVNRPPNHYGPGGPTEQKVHRSLGIRSGHPTGENPAFPRSGDAFR